MGMYDEVGKEGIQIKLLECALHQYSVGDEIGLEDGLYIGYEGYFVVQESRVLATGDKIFSKWGGKLEAEDILESHNFKYRFILYGLMKTRLNRNIGLT